MRVRHLDYVQLAMPAGREDEARNFYEGILGIGEVTKLAHLASHGECWFERGPRKVRLGVDADFTPARKAHPAVVVDDLRALVAKLEQGGYRVAEDRPLEGHDRRYVDDRYVDDPFGNRIELMQ